MSVEERMLSMRHKSRGDTVDASQSLYTKESFSHLFGISKKRGQEYKVPPNYETVVTESPVVTQTDGTVVDSTMVDSGIAQPAVKKTDSAVVDSDTQDLELAHSTMMNSGIAQPAIRQTESAIVDSETEGLESVRSQKMNPGITRPDVPIAEPDIIDLSRYETATESPMVTQTESAIVDSETEDLELVRSTIINSGTTPHEPIMEPDIIDLSRYETVTESPTVTQTNSAVVDSEMRDLGLVDSTMMNSGTTPYVPIVEPDIMDLTLSPSPKHDSDTDGQEPFLV